MPFFVSFYLKHLLHACSSKFHNLLKVSPRFFNIPQNARFLTASPLCLLLPQNAAIPHRSHPPQKHPFQPPRNAVENALQHTRKPARSRTRNGFNHFSNPRKSRLFARFPAPADRIQPHAATAHSEKIFTFLKIILNNA